MIDKTKRINFIRVPYDLIESDEYFASLINTILKYDCGISELAFFTSTVHSPLAIDELKRRLAVIKKRMTETRAHGLKAGINILATIGHHEEDMENAFSGDYTNMTDAYGRVCRGSYCMNDERYHRDYIPPVYKLLAETAPDFIWVDDDVRTSHMPIKRGCFCNNCMRIFNEKYGYSFTREALHSELDSGNVEVRRAFIKSRADAVARVMQTVIGAVRGVSDKIRMGWMPGDLFYEGMSFDRYADILSEGGKNTVMCRPGGGAYTDVSFDEIVDKASEIGRQNAYLPECVTIRASELENFPCDGLGKTPESSAKEVLLEVATGCTGSAFNILPLDPSDPIECVEPILERLSEVYPFELLLSEKLKGASIVGVNSGWFKGSQASLPDGCDYTSMPPAEEFCQYAKEIYDLGIPEAYNLDNSEVVMLKGSAVKGMTDGMIRGILSRGVYMDADALEYLNSMGYAEYTGFKKGREIPVDAHERLLSHPINRGVVGATRNCRQAFNKGASYEILPASKSSEIISDLVDYHGKPLANAASGIFENSLGGRVYVGGYYPFTKLLFYTKNIQLKNIMDYLSFGKLPLRVISHSKVRCWTCKSDKASYAVIFNVTNNLWKRVRIALNTDVERVKAYTENCLDGKEYTLEKTKNGERIITFNKLPAYEMILLEI